MKGIHQNETTNKHCEVLPTRQPEHSRSKQRPPPSIPNRCSSSGSNVTPFPRASHATCPIGTPHATSAVVSMLNPRQLTHVSRVVSYAHMASIPVADASPTDSVTATSETRTRPTIARAVRRRRRGSGMCVGVSRRRVVVSHNARNAPFWTWPSQNTLYGVCDDSCTFYTSEYFPHKIKTRVNVPESGIVSII